MKTISRYIMTLALLLTAVTGAWATEPRVINSEISHESLKVGDILVEGFSISGPYSTMFYFNAGRAKKGETLLTEDVKFYKGDITSVGTNAVITLYDGAYFDAAGTYTPIDENGQVANAWIVTSTNESGNSDFHLSGYKYVAPTADPAIDVIINDTKTTASFTMPASDVTVNYMLVRDLEDQTNKVTFSGLPTTGNIIVKKGSDSKYQPIETLTLQLNDALISGDDKNIIAATGITVTVEKKGDGDTWTSGTLADFLADMQPGTYRIKATATDENSPYDGTVYSSEFTVEEKYDLTVKPADEYSKTGLDNVTVGTETPTINEAGEAAKTGIAPNTTEVKIKAKTGYIITDVNATNINEVTINEAKTEATFTMPQSDVTATYTIKRDMSVNMAVTVQDAEQNIRFRVQKQGDTFVPVGMNMAQIVALFTVHDNIEDKNLTANTDFTVQFFAVNEEGQKTGEAIPFFDFDFAPGRYVAKAEAVDDSNYSGETVLSNVFILFQGYEVEVPAGEYITYYKDEALYVEDTDAKLYTITAVSGTTATADELTIAPANTPLLVKNNGSETKTILLIPTTTDTPDNVTPYEGFTGTLEAATIAASNATQDNYAWNGLQFVRVKTALSIAANKAWLQVPATASAPQRIQIVFSSTTGIGAIDSLQSEGEGAWYDLNGRRLPGKPTKKGVYIVNGKKMVVK